MKDLLILSIYKIIKKPYLLMFKKNPAWDLTIQDYLNYSEDSLGFHLGNFLVQSNLEIQPQLEDHDIHHVLTNIGITVLDEIDMQFYLWGNGRKTPSSFTGILAGLLFYPLHFKRFNSIYKKGKQAHRFYDLDFSKMLSQPIQTIQFAFNIK